MKKNQEFPRSKRIAHKINTHINLWSKNKDRIIIGIEGYSASKKTTIADCIAKAHKQVVVVHLDDILKSSEQRIKMMHSAMDRSVIFELNWYNYDLLNTIVQKFRHSTPFTIDIYDYDLKKTVIKNYNFKKQILIIEGIFLFHPEHEVSKIFDKRIYLDVDFEKADLRRDRREKKRWGKNYVDENHPNSFVKPYKEAYRRYYKTHHPEKLADLVIKII